MAGPRPIGANIAESQGTVVPTVSWPGLARPSTTGGADRGKDVDGRHRAGHDTEAAGPTMSAPMETRPAMTERQPSRPVPVAGGSCPHHARLHDVLMHSHLF